MAKKLHEIEKEIHKVTGAEPQKDGEKREKYLTRLAKAATSVKDKVWKTLSETTQAWANATAQAVNYEEAPLEFDAVGADTDDEGEDEEVAEKPAKKGKAKAAAEEEEGEEEEEGDAEEDDDAEEEEELDEEDEDEEEEEAPAKPAKKGKKPAAKADDEEEDDEEAEADDEEDEKPAKKAKAAKKSESAHPRTGAVKEIIKLCLKHPTWEQGKVIDTLKEKGIETSDATVATQFRNARNVMAVAKELNLLK